MLRLKKLSLCCLLPLAGLLVSGVTVAQSDRGILPAKVSSALAAAKIPGDAMALAVIPLEGQGLAQYVNADQPVNPASTMKLVTTYAALELLGPNYQWQTDLYGTGAISGGELQGDLIFRSSGDPKLTMERLWLMLRDLRAAGVREVRGDLVLQPADIRLPLDAGQFRDDGNDPSRPFLVEPDPLLTNLKLLSLKSFASADGVRTHLEPALPEVTIDNQLTTLPAVKSCPWPNVAYAIRDDGKRATITLTGSLHEGCDAERYLSVLDAPVYTASLIRILWHEMGGRIHGGNRIGPSPADARLLARSTSPDLVSVVRDINKYSNNTMARQLFLTIGREQRSAADTDDHKAANRIINQWLADKDIQPNGLVLENGSGLSRLERMTARDMAQLLAQAWESPYAAEFVASLPLAAMDGTMRRRMRNTPVAGQAHIKTGSLRNVRAIAGITRDNNGQSWAVAAIVNHPAAGASRQALDNLLSDVHRRGPTDVADSR
ncbi:D-alanyl-D-alanine carboxypeptidase/D-alanyl-D-alanine-endopeptidase [Halopseudomonas bauzanensis]|uniref:D-alanyl-D-alanine carboxypeptidase/D-alanyl-D-alanine-endopeptidase n=1 Tax=Halopseudomonas bauzanensis TaxID=653930 RepID=A0A4U0YEK0_9GAMM|nr:D-alanyl-D-alanine carboxypeptidase/D-alanyl-D-alanine-endopeptidase [Halopseudomonas bauzanensis]EZQ17169.1 D-alanyl-D-alanine carboxypeptidase [Halopseudomonas bauzanensis]TKA90252.1 D-alanyl-D-alanine carboxypeptidase/D-alanyl-D-alanine-endopeptidase [Halopseudomonas bauzanensis]